MINKNKKCKNNTILFLQIDSLTNLSNTEIILRLKREKQKGAQYLILNKVETKMLEHLKNIITQGTALGYKKLIINSNGEGFSDYKFAKSILGGNLYFIRIHISLCDQNEKNNDQYVKNKIGISTGIEAIKNIIKLKSKLVVNTPIYSLNCSRLNEFLDLLKTLKVKDINFWFIYTENCQPKHQNLIPSIETIVPHLKNAIDYANSISMNVGIVFLPFCLLDDYYRNFAVENQMSEEIKNSENIYKQSFKSQKCQKCNYFSKCPGIWKEYYKQRGFQFKPIKS